MNRNQIIALVFAFLAMSSMVAWGATALFGTVGRTDGETLEVLARTPNYRPPGHQSLAAPVIRATARETVVATSA